jgi:hypothetical protein
MRARSIVALAVVVVGSVALATAQSTKGPPQRDAAARAFEPIAAVMSSARCANCHIDGDAPLQGEEGRVHTMGVRRGTDGRGTPVMRCTNCHQDASSSVSHAPPGAPDWRVPPSATPMAWKGLTVGEQCRMLTDKARNGNRTPQDLLEHVRHDRLVLAGWSPGPGRTLPPISHDAFVEQFKTWVDLGGACPK